MTTDSDPSSASADRYFLEVREVTKCFGAFTALHQVSLGVRPGEFVSILGPSGCGKTTLLRVVAGLEPQTSGTVWIDGRDVSCEPVARRGLGIVFQSYALFPNLSVVRNVGYGLRGQTPSLRRDRALEMLELVGLTDQADKFPAQLSGGQQQRVALARALAPNPSLLLLDEPLSALDARVRVRLRGEIRRIQQKLGVTTIMVTHDQEEALTMADRIVVMDRGRLMQYADPRGLYAAPANPFVAGFIGSMNFLPRCRRHGPRKVGLYNYTFEIRSGHLPENAESVTLAIRPEHLRLASSPVGVANCIRARVREVEFRGPVSRAVLQALYPEGHPSELTLEMDIQTEGGDPANLRPETDVHLELPAEHLLAFPAGAAAAGAGGAGRPHAA